MDLSTRRATDGKSDDLGKLTPENIIASAAPTPRSQITDLEKAVLDISPSARIYLNQTKG
jgi:hypothetical protein